VERLRKPTKTSVRIVYFPTEVRNRYNFNISQTRYHLRRFAPKSLFRKQSAVALHVVAFCYSYGYLFRYLDRLTGYFTDTSRLMQYLRPGMSNFEQLYVYTRQSAEIQTPKHRNLTDRSMTAPPRVLSPSSRPILPSTSSPSYLVPAIKNAVRFKKYFNFLTFFKNYLNQ